MDFSDLQDRLRDAMLARIASGEFTGVEIARASKFRQAHLSNFLRDRRSLSIDAMDRILRTLGMSVVDLVDPRALARLASSRRPPAARFEAVPLVSLDTAATHGIIRRRHVLDLLMFKRNFLASLRPALMSARPHWQRFVLIRADTPNGTAMYPRLTPGGTLLIDRHYNSPAPYRRGDKSIYAVRFRNRLVLRYVEIAGDTLILRPHNIAYDLETIPLLTPISASDLLIGRVANLSIPM